MRVNFSPKHQKDFTQTFECHTFIGTTLLLHLSFSSSCMLVAPTSEVLSAEYKSLVKKSFHKR